MTPEEAAYVGSMIDAEGWVTHHGSNQGFNRHKTQYPGISIANQEVEIISAMIRATGCGRVNLKDKPGRNTRLKKIIWSWNLRRVADVEAVAQQCAPYSMKCQKVLKWLEEYERRW